MTDEEQSSNEVSPETLEEIRIKEERFLREQKRQRMVNLISYSAIILIASVILMVLSGDRFSGVLGFFGIQGIENERRGVYVDCSKSENRNKPYCQPMERRQTAVDRSWNSLRHGKGKTNPFSLNRPNE